MNKKILLIVLSFLCLSSTYALELPEQIVDLGKRAIHIWFWELDDSVDDRSDIEANVLTTIKSTNSLRINNAVLVLGVPNLKIFTHWLDAGFENYQHFDDVIHKIDDRDKQLDGFRDYIVKNYGDRTNDYHILMTENGWGNTAGLAFNPGNYAIATDNRETTAAHEMGHMLGAKHNSDTYEFDAPIMYAGYLNFYSRDPVFWGSENKRKAKKTLSELQFFPDHSDISYRYGRKQSTTIGGAKYNTIHNTRYWDKSSTKVYKMSTSSKFTYTIETEEANFDTYIYVYNDKGELLASDDDDGYGSLSKLSNQYFGLNKTVYIVVSGYNHAEGEFTIKVDRAIDNSVRLDPKKTYAIKSLNGCGLEWDGGYNRASRNAKFDCSGRYDPVYFEKVANYKGYSSHSIKAKVQGKTCSLGWGWEWWNWWDFSGRLTALFHCVSGKTDPMHLTRDNKGYYYIEYMSSGVPECSLKMSPDINNGEGDAKIDCTAKPDPLIITEVGLK